MVALVIVSTFVVLMLGILVAGLLRSHADILRALHDLGIRELQRQQRDSAHDRLGAQAAGRMLALVSVNTAFYEPKQYFARGDPAGALAMLAIAHEIVPDSPYICFQQAKAYAEMGRTGEVLASLRCARAGGSMTVVDLRNERAFDRLRSDSAFAALAATFAPANDN